MLVDLTHNEIKYLKLCIGQEINWEYTVTVNKVDLSKLYLKLKEGIDGKNKKES